MDSRNDIQQLTAAGIPATLTKFACGCWGRHLPPSVDDAGQIVFATGQGYRSSKHTHGQNLYVLAADPQQHVALVEMRKYGDLYGAGMWHYLVGIDGAPFVAQIPNTIDDLPAALDYLQPAEVKRALAAGLPVVRQGDWWFIPVSRTPRGTAQPRVALDGDHVADEAIIGQTVAYARGTVRHSQHGQLDLTGWHKAIRNRAIRTGRLALGLGPDAD